MAGQTTKRAGRKPLWMGLLVAAFFAGALYVALAAHDGLPGQTGQVLRIGFDNVGALREGDDVRIANIRVGQVNRISLVNGKPEVTVRVDSGHPVFRDASAVTASVGARSALGQKYVDFNPGHPNAGPIDDNAVVPAAKTVGAQEISDVLRALDEPTRQSLGSTLRESGGGALGHAGDFHDATRSLPGTLPDLGTVSRALSADNGAALGRTLTAADQLASSFAGRQQELGQLAGRMSTTLRSVDADGGQSLHDTLRKAPDTMARLDSALRDIRQPLADTEASMTTLRTGAESLGGATRDVRGVLREGVRPLDRLAGVADQARPAVDALAGTMRDARPLAPELTHAASASTRPLADMAPYWPEISMFFTTFADALQYGDQNGHYLRIYPPIAPQSATGLTELKDPTVARKPYARPGEALSDRQSSLLDQGAGK